MDSIFLHLQNFTVVSYCAFAIVLISFFIETKSNSPYKSLFLSNVGFGIYNFTILTRSEMDFPIYFILLSFLICSWFFVLKNIEEEEDEDRGYLRNYHNESIVGFNEIESKRKTTPQANSPLFNFKDFLINESSKIFENRLILVVIFFFENDPIYYEHPQRKFVHVFTYLILISILISFFLV